MPAIGKASRDVAPSRVPLICAKDQRRGRTEKSRARRTANPRLLGKVDGLLIVRRRGIREIFIYVEIGWKVDTRASKRDIRAGYLADIERLWVYELLRGVRVAIPLTRLRMSCCGKVNASDLD